MQNLENMDVFEILITQKNAKMQKDPFVRFTLICIPKISKISQRVEELLSAQTFPYKAHSRDITHNGSNGEQPFLHVTHHLDLIYMSRAMR